MTKDKFKTKVIFCWFQGELIALFVPKGFEYEKYISSYMHVGQHSDACFLGVMQDNIIPSKSFKLASEEEFMHLYWELENAGYNLAVANTKATKRIYNKFCNFKIKSEIFVSQKKTLNIELKYLEGNLSYSSFSDISYIEFLNICISTQIPGILQKYLQWCRPFDSLDNQIYFKNRNEVFNFLNGIIKKLQKL